MSDVFDLLIRYGYLLLFVVVMAEQIGLPIPAVPVLLALGALARSGRMSWLWALAVALAASLPPDLVWYFLGRLRGTRILSILCRLSLEPDSCVRRTEDSFVRHGKRTILIAKFLPGISTITPPVAGMAGVGLVQFLVLDSLAALLWAGAWMALGFVFSEALGPVAALAARLGHWGLVAVGACLAAYITPKFVKRQRFLRTLRMARILPEDLKRRIEAREELLVVDTRSPIDVDAVPYVIRGARWIAAEDIDRRQGELPRDRDIILYCS